MPYALVLLTGHQADDPEASALIERTIEFHTGDVESSIMARIETIVQLFVNSADLWSLDALAFEHEILSGIYKTLAAIHDGDPSGPLTFTKSYTTETLFTIKLWVGPAE